jgi:hypothetical protein
VDLEHSYSTVQPSKATVEFGIELGIEPGKLTALLVQGTSKANLKINLEWRLSTKFIKRSLRIERSEHAQIPLSTR